MDIFKTSYFPALTGVRAIAACMVFLHHFNPFKKLIFGDFIYPFVGEFHVGVTIFFVLSGFLIYHRYAEVVTKKGEGIRKYFVNRFARIYPMYFIFTILSFLPFICNCNFSDNIHVFFLNLTFIRGFFDDYKFTGVPGGWSLTVEEMFYCIFPLLILFSSRIKIIFQMLFFLGVGFVLWTVFKNVSGHGFFSSLDFVFEFTFFGRCFEFFIGMQLASFVKSKGSILADYKIPYKTMAGIFCIVLLIAMLAINRMILSGSIRFLFFETMLNNFVLPLGIALFFYGLITESSFVRKILETRTFDLLGKSSYVFYLIHNGFLFQYFYATLQLNLVVIFILLIVISILLYLFVEKPLNNLIRKKLI